MDAINLLANIPTAFGAPAAALQPGQVVQALVLELLDSGAFRLQLPQSVVDVRTDVPLTPGSTVTLAVKGTGSSVRFDILAQSNPGSPSAPPDVATSQTGRRPIGEAVVVARTGLPDAKAPAAPVARNAPVEPPTPAAALAQAVRAAAARQGGLAPLFADVEQAVTAAGSAMPEPVRAAATQLLALRVPLDESLTAADLKQAFTRSGVLLEFGLAAAAKGAPSAPPQASAGADLKAALLVLRQALKTWVAPAANAAAPAPKQGGLTLGKADALAPGKTEVLTLVQAEEFAKGTGFAKGVDFTRDADWARSTLSEAAVQAGVGTPLSPQDAEDVAKSLSALLAKATAPAPSAPGANGPAPPYRGAPLSPQSPALPSMPGTAAPREIAERLTVQTDAAIARGTLLQAASLPDAANGAPRGESGPRWSFEIPFATPQGTGIVPFEVARDGRATPAEPQAATWRARFSLDMEPIGPVHALVALTGDRVSVTLCAERLSTAAQLNDSAPLLGDALRSAELQPNEVTVRVGTPRAVTPAAPGRFMDRAS